MDLEDVMLKRWYILREVIDVSEKFECIIIKLEYKLFESQARCFTEAHLAVLRWNFNFAGKSFLWLLVLFGC